MQNIFLLYRCAPYHSGVAPFRNKISRCAFDSGAVSLLEFFIFNRFEGTRNVGKFAHTNSLDGCRRRYIFYEISAKNNDFEAIIRKN